MRDSDRSNLNEIREFLGSAPVVRRAARCWPKLVLAVGALVLILCSARIALAWHSGRGAANLTQAQAIAVLRDGQQDAEQHRAAIEALCRHAAQAADILAELARSPNPMLRSHAVNAQQDIARRLR
jgi:hypothetical protein